MCNNLCKSNCNNAQIKACINQLITFEIVYPFDIIRGLARMLLEFVFVSGLRIGDSLAQNKETRFVFVTVHESSFIY